MGFVSEQLSPGLGLHFCETDRFKTVTLCMYLHHTLSLDTVSELEVLPGILESGTTKHPTSMDLARRFEDLYGVDISVSTARLGESQFLKFELELAAPNLIPDGDSVLTAGITTFGQIVLDPLREGSGFKQEYFALEKKNLHKQIEDLINHKQVYAMQRAVKHMFAGEPYGTPMYGTVDTVQALENEPLFRRFQDLIRRRPIEIFAVGPGAKPAAQQFGAMVRERRASDVAAATIPSVVRKEVRQEKFVEEHHDVKQAILVMGYRTPIDWVQDTYYPLRLFNELLGGHSQSRLFVHVREKEQLAYYAHSGLDGAKGVLTVMAGVSAMSVSRTRSIIEQQVTQLQAAEISRQELDQAKKHIISALKESNDHPSLYIGRNMIGLLYKRRRSVQEAIAAVEEVSARDIGEAGQTLALDTVYVMYNQEEKGS